MAKRSDALVCDPDRMNMQRMAAVAVVACGGVFWALAAFSGAYVFSKVGLTQAIGSALIPLALTVVVFVLGWFSEAVTALLLYGLSAACMVWGAVTGWDLGMWGLMVTFFIAPMVAAGGLYFAAWRMENVCGGAHVATGLLAAPETSSLR